LPLFLIHSGEWFIPPSDIDYNIFVRKVIGYMERIVSKSSGNSPIKLNNKSKINLNTALIYASMIGNYEDVQKLLQLGANPLHRDLQACSPVHYAAKIGDMKILAKLNDYGADLEGLDVNGYCPLHVASIFGHVDIINYLLESAVDVNKRTNISQNSSLHIATENGWLDCCQVLLEYDAILTSKNKEGLTPIDLAKSMDSFYILDYFKKYYKSNLNHDFEDSSEKKATHFEEDDDLHSISSQELRNIISNGAYGNTHGDDDKMTKDLNFYDIVKSVFELFISIFFNRIYTFCNSTIIMTRNIFNSSKENQSQVLLSQKNNQMLYKINILLLSFKENNKSTYLSIKDYSKNENSDSN
jgi:ankyrin repeat protein